MLIAPMPRVPSAHWLRSRGLPEDLAGLETTDPRWREAVKKLTPPNLPVNRLTPEYLARHGYDVRFAGRPFTDPEYVAAVNERRAALNAPNPTASASPDARTQAFRNRPTQPIPGDYSPDDERRRLRHGGCCDPPRQ